MTKNKYYIILIFLFGLTLNAKNQNFEGRQTVGEKYAKEILTESLKDTTKNYIIHTPLTQLKDKDTTIIIAEDILFKMYGSKMIKNERPYECYLLDNYWVIMGTLPINTDGGTFTIILDARNCKIIRVTHGQ